MDFFHDISVFKRHSRIKGKFADFKDVDKIFSELGHDTEHALYLVLLDGLNFPLIITIVLYVTVPFSTPYV